MHVIFPYESGCLVCLKMPLLCSSDNKEKNKRKWKGALKLSLRSTPIIFSIESPSLNQPDAKQEPQNLTECSITDVAAHPSTPHCFYIAPMLREKKIIKKIEISKQKMQVLQERTSSPLERAALRLPNWILINPLPWWAQAEAEGETGEAPGRWWGISCRPAVPARRKPWCWS